MENKFTDEDKTKVVEFLNLIAKHAKFEMTTHEIISYFKLLSYMQSTILTKLDANILEITKVIEKPNKKK